MKSRRAIVARRLCRKQPRPDPGRTVMRRRGAPCNLTNFFIADPPLEQVVARTWRRARWASPTWAPSGSSGCCRRIAPPTATTSSISRQTSAVAPISRMSANRGAKASKSLTARPGLRGQRQLCLHRRDLSQSAGTEQPGQPRKRRRWHDPCGARQQASGHSAPQRDACARL